MTLKTFAANNAATDAEINPAINDIPSTFLHAVTGTDRPITGKSGQSKYLVASIPLRPACGNYLVILCSAYVASGTGEFWFDVVQGVKRDEVFNVGSITGTTPPTTPQSVAVNMTALTNGGDVTGKDCTLELFLSPDCTLQSIRVWSGDSSAVTDYGG